MREAFDLFGAKIGGLLRCWRGVDLGTRRSMDACWTGIDPQRQTGVRQHRACVFTSSARWRGQLDRPMVYDRYGAPHHVDVERLQHAIAERQADQCNDDDDAAGDRRSFETKLPEVFEGSGTDATDRLFV